MSRFGKINGDFAKQLIEDNHTGYFIDYINVLIFLLLIQLLTHSLTRCCGWPAEGRSDLLNDRSMAVNCIIKLKCTLNCV